MELRQTNDIRWVEPFDGKDKVCLFNREQTSSVLSLKSFLERYVRGENDMPHLRLHLEEFDDWQVLVPFQAGAVSIVCCPEDKTCKGSSPCNLTAFCKECSVPVCRGCEQSLYGKEPDMPPGSLANDMMVFYAPSEIYVEEMTVMEMICCSVCITSMICFSLEVRHTHTRTATDRHGGQQHAQ